MLELQKTREWEEAFKFLYSGDSLRAYRGWTCVKCRREFDSLLHRGCCPYCGHHSILTEFLEKATAKVEQFLEGKTCGVG
ncbi:MAG: hypothetical protein ACE5LD_03590 [Candidatus Bipolaricaulia bacterium]